jgi:hypothetical protein
MGRVPAGHRANSARQAVTVVDGKPILPNRTRDAGLIFFNDEGDEERRRDGRGAAGAKTAPRAASGGLSVRHRYNAGTRR